jgi:hypothetical protein
MNKGNRTRTDHHRVVLPILPTPAQPPPFEAGTLVYLANCQCGEPGRVVGFERGRVLVRWDGLRFTGRHKADTLVLAADAEHPAET